MAPPACQVYPQLAEYRHLLCYAPLSQVAGRSSHPHTCFLPTEQRALCNLPRKAGKAPPPRLTSTQRKVIGALIDKHGEDNVHVSPGAVGLPWVHVGSWGPGGAGAGAPSADPGQELLITLCMASKSASGPHGAHAQLGGFGVVRGREAMGVCAGCVHRHRAVVDAGDGLRACPAAGAGPKAVSAYCALPCQRLC